MLIRFFQPITIFAQRVSFQSTCVKIRTSSNYNCALLETTRDYYSEEFSISGRTSKRSVESNKSYSSSISSALPVLPSFSTVEGNSSTNSEKVQHRMPVVAAVVAHRRILPPANYLAGSTAGSRRSSGGAVRLNILTPPVGNAGLTGASKKVSKLTASNGTNSGADGKGSIRPLIGLKQFGAILKASGKENVLAESRRYYAKGKDKPKTKSTKIVINEEEMRDVIDVDKYKLQLEKLLEQMKDEYTKQLNIRGAAGALELIQVEFDGETYPLQELAQVGRKNPQMAVLNLSSLPDAIKPVLKAIEASGMNLNPQQEGTTIFVPLPKVTREHRENLAKNAKALFIKYKTALQGVQNKYVKQCKSQKDGLSEDLLFSVQQQIMKYADNYIADAEKLMVLKQEELLDTK